STSTPVASFGFGGATGAVSGAEEKKDGKPVEEKKTDAATPASGAAATSTPTPAAVPSGKGASPEYSALDIKTIIQSWYKELAQDALEFESQSHRVNMWDKQLRENQKTLESVVDNVYRIVATQSDLKQACESIEAYQSDLEADLSSLSNALDVELESLQLQEPTEDDFERENAYLAAENLNDALSQVQ
ncbi:hypothetical protein EON64_21275, partial [archaeon]